MNALRVSWLFFKLGVLNELQYRVNFFVSLFQAAIALVTGLVVLALVYSHTEELNGWTQPELLCVLGIQILMGGLIRTTIQPNMTRLIEDVHDGKLDYALTKPEDAQMLVSVREVRIWQVVDVFSGVIVLILGLSRISTDVSATDAAAFAVSLAQTGRWPIGIYPPWLRVGVTFLVPIAFAVTVPAEALTSRLDWQTFVLAFVFAVVLFAATRWFWRFGLRRYSGASA